MKHLDKLIDLSMLSQPITEPPISDVTYLEILKAEIRRKWLFPKCNLIVTEGTKMLG